MQSSNHVSTLKDASFIDPKFKIESEQVNGKHDDNNFDNLNQKKYSKRL